VAGLDERPRLSAGLTGMVAELAWRSGQGKLRDILWIDGSVILAFELSVLSCRVHSSTVSLIPRKDSDNPSSHSERALPKTKARVGHQSRRLDQLGVRFSCRATTCPPLGLPRHCPTRVASRG
jgi:hypothetical protein